MRYKPPIDRTFPWVEIRRELATEDLEVTIPGGDTFDLSLEEVRLYLKQLGVPELKAEKALDKVWNFYAIRFHLMIGEKQYLPETLEPTQYPEVISPRPLEQFAWIIESGRTK